MGINLGSLILDNPVILAPMSGVTDQPFRQTVKDCGAGLLVSEMIASQAMIRQERESVKESRKMSSDCQEEFPLAVQLAGCEPEVMAEAAKLNQDRGAAVIDINFGCPAKKVVNKYVGSAIMQDEVLAGRILEATVKAVSLPVTLKMRTGWNLENRNAPRIAQIAKDCGIRMVTVHGRTRCQKFKGKADWDFVQAVKDAVDLPLIINGDIEGPEDAKRALQASGADGVMIGRGAYGRPWLLRQVEHFLRSGDLLPDPGKAEQLTLIERHYERILSHYGIRNGVRIARKHLSWYAKGLRDAAGYRAAINREEDPDQVRHLLRELYSTDSETDLAKGPLGAAA